MWRAFKVIMAIACTAIAGMCIFVTNSNETLLFINDFLGTKFLLHKLQAFFLIMGYLIQIIGVGFPYAYETYKLDKVSKQSALNLKFIKEVYEEGFIRITGCRGPLELNIRIFLPQNSGFWSKLKFIFWKEKPEIYFKIRNHAGLARINDNTRNLSFRVDPIPQGLVGQCYQLKKIVWDNELNKSIENAKKTYNMTDFQIDKTREAVTVICFPVQDSDGKVKAIVSFDSACKINLTNKDGTRETELAKFITCHSLELWEYLPYLFK